MEDLGGHRGTFRLTAGGERASHLLQIGCLMVALVFTAFAGLTFVTARDKGWHWILIAFGVIALGWAVWSWRDQKARRAGGLELYEAGLRLKQGRIEHVHRWGDFECLRPVRPERNAPNALLATMTAPNGDEMPVRWVLQLRDRDGIVIDLRHWEEPYALFESLGRRIPVLPDR